MEEAEFKAIIQDEWIEFVLRHDSEDKDSTRVVPPSNEFIEYLSKRLKCGFDSTTNEFYDLFDTYSDLVRSTGEIPNQAIEPQDVMEAVYRFIDQHQKVPNASESKTESFAYSQGSISAELGGYGSPMLAILGREEYIEENPHGNRNVQARKASQELNQDVKEQIKRLENEKDKNYEDFSFKYEK